AVQVFVQIRSSGHFPAFPQPDCLFILLHARLLVSSQSFSLYYTTVPRLAGNFFVVPSSAASRSEEGLLIFWGLHLEKEALPTAAVETLPASGLPDQRVLRLLQLQMVHEHALVDGAGVKQKLVVGMAKRGFVSSATPGSRKSLRFWLARIRLESRFRARLS